MFCLLLVSVNPFLPDLQKQQSLLNRSTHRLSHLHPLHPPVIRPQCTPWKHYVTFCQRNKMIRWWGNKWWNRGRNRKIDFGDKNRRESHAAILSLMLFCLNVNCRVLCWHYIPEYLFHVYMPCLMFNYFTIALTWPVVWSCLVRSQSWERQSRSYC